MTTGRIVADGSTAEVSRSSRLSHISSEAGIELRIAPARSLIVEFFCGSLVLFSLSLLVLVIGGALGNMAARPVTALVVLGAFVPFNAAFAAGAYLMFWFTSSYWQVISVGDRSLSWRWGGRFFRASGSVPRDGAIVYPRRTGFLEFYRSADWNVFGGGNWEVPLREPGDPAHVVAWGLSRSDAFRVVEMISECGIAKGDPDAM